MPQWIRKLLRMDTPVDGAPMLPEEAIDRAVEARHQAEQLRAVAEAREPVVQASQARGRALRRSNHFADLMYQAMGGGK